MLRTHNDVIQAFAGKKILIVGDLILDEYVWGKVRRISPEAPVPVVEFERRTYRLGGAGNVAANVLSLGGIPLLASAIGTDPHGQQVKALLQESGMDALGVAVIPERWTTTKTRLMAHNQQIARTDYERRDSLSARQEDDLLAWVENCIADADACVLSDYAKGLMSPRMAEKVVRLARGKPVLVDPKGTNFAKYRGATLVKPNLHEVERLQNHEITDEAELLEAGDRLLELLDGSAVLITRGSEGMSLFRPDRAPMHIPSLARNVYDVTGAGDTVAGTLALALAVGADLESAARLANQAAGIAVGKVGTAQVTIEELLAADGAR
jgi:D-glycero-beta-D-manno-heptose-7-phosphate kinase